MSQTIRTEAWQKVWESMVNGDLPLLPQRQGPCGWQPFHLWGLCTLWYQVSDEEPGRKGVPIPAGGGPVLCRRWPCVCCSSASVLSPRLLQTVPTSHARYNCCAQLCHPRQVCLGSSPTGETIAGEPGQGGMERSQHRTADFPLCLSLDTGELNSRW